MYNVAIIGYGYWGPKLARNIQNSNNFKINFIVDKSDKNLNIAKTNFPLCKLSKDYKNIDHEKVDLVVISTPTITHFKIANYFLKKTNVLIEKPVALSIKDVKKLENISKIFTIGQSGLQLS